MPDLRKVDKLIEKISHTTIHHTRRNHETFIALAASAYFRSQRQALDFSTLTIDSAEKAVDEAKVSKDRLERSILLAYLAGLLWSKRKFTLERAYNEADIHIILYKAHVDDLVKQLDATTVKDIQDVLTGAAEANVNAEKALKELFVSYSTDRATRIGVYEGRRAFTLGSYSALVDTGEPYQKLWLTQGDDKVTEDCLANAAQGWIGLTVVYNNGVQCPPEHLGCRCALDYRKKV